MRATLLGILLWAGLSAAAQADQSVTAPGVVVHYSAINTTALSPEAALKLGVQRRASHAVVILSPRHVPQAADALDARASGVVRRLTGQRQNLAWRTVQVENQADLISEFEIQDGEYLNFDLSVLPDGLAAPLVVRFRQQFYRD
ncbi:MAG: DUF4426 domain-containing protein [Panacagrimonas sp.]